MRERLENVLQGQRERFFGWVPVSLGLGIGGYFSLPVEPDVIVMLLGGIAVLCLFVGARLVPAAFAPLLIALVLIVTGAGLAKWRVTSLDAPVLGFRYYGPIQGEVVHIDRSSSDALRLTLDGVVLARMGQGRTPQRVRVSLHGDQPYDRFHPGDTLIMTGHLAPPSGPAEPGGFDFQRHAWFMQLGAVGYTRTPVLRLAQPSQVYFRTRIFTWRMALSAAVQRTIPGETGGIAAAIMTGDRSGLPQPVLEDLRASNLAHLLAISGLHMGLLTGFIFAAVRYGLALVPWVALRWPAKKIAAVCALIAGAFYLALSGGNVATERAYIMVSVMFLAVLLDRRALTLRAVAIAATIVLVWRPEALSGPGFQMSFAATTALVAAFAGLRRYNLSNLPQWTRPVLSVVLSSLVAGLATAPFAAAHFNQIAHYGLIANLLSVPLMGLIVMPAAVLAICLAPLGLWTAGLWVMEQGLRWILFVAHTVSGWEGALSHVWAPSPWVVPLLSLGLLWMLLIVGSARFAGLVVVIVAFGLWVQSPRPALLVADNGNLIGLQTAQGRALSKARGSGFVAGIWLENDGGSVAQDIAAARSGLHVEGRRVIADLGAWRIMQVSGKTALAEIEGCGGADVLVSNQVDIGDRPCLVYDVTALRATGSLALDVNQSGDLVITTAHRIAGARPWNARQGLPVPQIVMSKTKPTGRPETRLSGLQNQ